MGSSATAEWTKTICGRVVGHGEEQIYEVRNRED
jgi:hypothetical protein